MLIFSQLIADQVKITLHDSISHLTLLQLIGALLQLGLLTIMVAASLRKLLEELHLVILLNPVQLTELIQFGHQRVNHLHAFEKFCTTFLVTSVLLTLRRAVFALEVRKLVLEGCHIPLLRPQLHHFLLHLVQESVLVALVHYRRFSCL